MLTAHDRSFNTIQKQALLIIAVDKNKLEEVEICLSNTNNHAIETLQLISNKANLLSPGQFSEQEVNMKTRGLRMYLYQKRKIFRTEFRVE